MKIYIASSWRHPDQPWLVRALRSRGYDVYDFRESNGFNWRDIPDAPRSVNVDGQFDGVRETWPMETLKKALDHDVAKNGFETDLFALERCDALVLLLPAGNDAHLEAGWCAGRKKPVFVFSGSVDGSQHEVKPGLMYKLASDGGAFAGGICADFIELCDGLARVRART